jgi:hypothetical protein
MYMQLINFVWNTNTVKTNKGVTIGTWTHLTEFQENVLKIFNENDYWNMIFWNMEEVEICIFVSKLCDFSVMFTEDMGEKSGSNTNYIKWNLFHLLFALFSVPYDYV